MENITIGQIVIAIGVISTIGGFFTAIFKWYKSHITDEFSNIKKDLNEHMKAADKRIELIEKKIANQYIDMKESKEERLILMEGLLACLKGLSEQGCDGPVTAGISKIENYLIKKSHE